jgi:hypothetical protein
VISRLGHGSDHGNGLRDRLRLGLGSGLRQGVLLISRLRHGSDHGDRLRDGFRLGSGNRFINRNGDGFRLGGRLGGALGAAAAAAEAGTVGQLFAAIGTVETHS